VEPFAHPESIQFAEPQWLWLLLLPLLLLAVWLRQLQNRRRDVTRLAEARRVPIHERLPFFGDTLFSLGLIGASALVIIAIARPGVVISMVRTGGVDMVVLLDGSASMHTRDVSGDRWKRSIRFLRTLGDSLRWDDDRVALTLFARIAAPQVRLTKDPNTFFFFLDNLQDKSPFPLEDDTSWDTNSELGVFWGLRVIEKDEEIRGKSKNAPLFVMISDGQSWSGEIEKSLKLARERDVPVITIGVGTLAGGVIPEPTSNLTPATLSALPPPPRIYSTLDRGSLKQIATASGGEYLELDRDSDINIATHIVDLARRRVVTLPPEPKMEELYWPVLAAAGVLALLGALSIRDRGALMIQLAGGGLTLAALASLLG
jgi:Ca-activated chloride channel family protein